MATASLVLGILSLVFVFCAFPFAFVGVILGILAVIFGAVAKGRHEPKSGMATAGFILGIIGVSFGTIFTMLFITVLSIISSFGSVQIGNLESFSQWVNGILDWIQSLLKSLEGVDASLKGALIGV